MVPKLMKSILLYLFIADLTITSAQKDVNLEDDNDDVGAPLNDKDFEAAANLVEKLDPQQKNMDDLFKQDFLKDRGTGRNANRDRDLKWPNATIPYTITSQFSSYERSIIAYAIKEFQNKTCMRIKERSGEPDYIHIYKGSGCYSEMGKMGGKQLLTLGNGCVTVGIALHEFMHAAGFWHEHSRSDRDKYIRINWGNIQNTFYARNAFTKYSQDKIDHLNAPYDYCSILHYPTWAFSKNGRPTITYLKEGKCRIGQRSKLSEIDVRKINTLYECTGYPQVACIDEFQDCSLLAAKGFCTQKYVRFMSDKCQKSCNLCDKGCYDEDWDCPEFAKAGYCSTTHKGNLEYMAKNCRMSCKFC